MTIEALEGVTDRELFDEANADEVTTEVVAEPAEQIVEEKPEAVVEEKPAVAETVVAEKPAVDDNAPQVPSWRVREINEEKRQIAAENERMKAELAQLRQAPRQVEQPRQPEKAVRPDPLLDPDGFAEAVRQELREEALSERREESLRMAAKAHPDEFKDAYAAAQLAVDPALKARMQATRDPGTTLLEWHRERKAMAEVGTDPNAYFQKKLDAWLADPANQAKVIEKARGDAQQQLQPGKAPAVSLPPSLTRATNASGDASADDNDVSDEGLWRHANAS